MSARLLFPPCHRPRSRIPARGRPNLSTVPGLRRVPDGWRGRIARRVPAATVSVPAPRHTTSGWAIAAFLLGFLSCVPLSVIFGIIALVKTKDGRQGGNRCAAR